MSHWVVLSLVIASIALMILLTSRFKCNIFMSMFLVSLALGIAALPTADVVPAIKEGFGGTMKANIGHLIGLGLLIAMPGAAAGFAWARWACRHMAPETADALPGDAQVVFESQALPSTLHSFLPIFVPLALLTVRSALMVAQTSPSHPLVKMLLFVGYPEVALLIGVGLAISLYPRIGSGELTQLFDAAIEKAGPVFMLIGAGGIFGAVIKATGIGEFAGAHLATTGLGLCIPFAVVWACSLFML